MLAQRGIELDGLVGRHLFRQRDDADAALLRIGEQRLHPVHVARERALVDQAQEDFGHGEEREAVPGGGCVEDHQVPAQPAALGVVRGVPPHLAEHDDLGERGRGGEKVARRRVLEGNFIQSFKLDGHQRVLAHGFARPHVDAVQIRQQLADPGPRRRLAEKIRHPLARYDLADQNLLAAPRRSQRERRRDRALAGAALPRHHHEASAEEGGLAHGAADCSVRSGRRQPRLDMLRQGNTVRTCCARTPCSRK